MQETIKSNIDIVENVKKNTCSWIGGDSWDPARRPKVSWYLNSHYLQDDIISRDESAGTHNMSARRLVKLGTTGRK